MNELYIPLAIALLLAFGVTDQTNSVTLGVGFGTVVFVVTLMLISIEEQLVTLRILLEKETKDVYARK